MEGPARLNRHVDEANTWYQIVLHVPNAVRENRKYNANDQNESKEHIKLIFSVESGAVKIENKF